MRIKKLILIAIYLLILVIILKAFFIGAYRIPTTSMAKTLLAGDFIIVSKAAYELRTPGEIPFLGIRIPSKKLIDFSKPQINDLIVFGFPSFYKDNEYYYSEKLVKRIVAGPGDTLQIINKKIYVNNKKLKLPVTSQVSYSNVKPPGFIDKRIFPPGMKWNSDNYGPVVVPAKGDTIKLNVDNIDRWKQLIVFEMGEKSVRREGTVITVNGKPTREYIVRKDHYFVMGDNFNNSKDSRYFGFINEDMILGKVLFIYWSVDPHRNINSFSDFFKGIRTERIFKSPD